MKYRDDKNVNCVFIFAKNTILKKIKETAKMLLFKKKKGNMKNFVTEAHLLAARP